MAEGRLMWMAPKILISNDENNIGLTIQLRLPVTTQNSEDLKHRNGLDRAGAVCHTLAFVLSRSAQRAQTFRVNSL